MTVESRWKRPKWCTVVRLLEGRLTQDVVERLKGCRSVGGGWPICCCSGAGAKYSSSTRSAKFPPPMSQKPHLFLHKPNISATITQKYSQGPECDPKPLRSTSKSTHCWCNVASTVRQKFAGACISNSAKWAVLRSLKYPTGRSTVSKAHEPY